MLQNAASESGEKASRRQQVLVALQKAQEGMQRELLEAMSIGCGRIAGAQTCSVVAGKAMVGYRCNSIRV